MNDQPMANVAHSFFVGRARGLAASPPLFYYAVGTLAPGESTRLVPVPSRAALESVNARAANSLLVEAPPESTEARVDRASGVLRVGRVVISESYASLDAMPARYM